MPAAAETCLNGGFDKFSYVAATSRELAAAIVDWLADSGQRGYLAGQSIKSRIYTAVGGCSHATFTLAVDVRSLLSDLRRRLPDGVGGNG